MTDPATPTNEAVQRRFPDLHGEMCGSEDGDWVRISEDGTEHPCGVLEEPTCSHDEKGGGE